MSVVPVLIANCDRRKLHRGDRAVGHPRRDAPGEEVPEDLEHAEQGEREAEEEEHSPYRLGGLEIRKSRV